MNVDVLPSALGAQEIWPKPLVESEVHVLASGMSMPARSASARMLPDNEMVAGGAYPLSGRVDPQSTLFCRSIRGGLTVSDRRCADRRVAMQQPLRSEAGPNFGLF
ncbi:protein of unknown function (plasmid) [Caballeronia sp. S22]